MRVRSGNFSIFEGKHNLKVHPLKGVTCHQVQICRTCPRAVRRSKKEQPVTEDLVTTPVGQMRRKPIPGPMQADPRFACPRSWQLSGARLACPFIRTAKRHRQTPGHCRGQAVIIPDPRQFKPSRPYLEMGRAKAGVTLGTVTE